MADESTGVRPKKRRGPGRPMPQNLKPPWKPGQSGNPGGRPKTEPGFRERCRAIAVKLASRIEREDFTYTSGSDEGPGYGTDVAGLVRAFEAMADRGGYLPADKHMTLLLKALESPALKEDDRKRVLDELVGKKPEELPAADASDPPSQK